MKQPSINSIEHPTQPNWLQNGSIIPTDAQQQALFVRFEQTGQDIAGLIGAVALATARTDTYRQHHEQETVGYLGLYTNASQRGEYVRLAGRPEHTVDFMIWFSKSAAAFLGNRPQTSPISKLGLELGSKRQGGDWECTQELDGMICAIPEAAEQYPHVRVITKDRPAQRAVSYRFAALVGGDISVYPFGLIRRRRAVADIHIANQLPLHIFKESIGLAVLDQITPSAREKIRTDYAKNPANNVFTKNGLNNTTAANTAGHVFYQAIHAEKGESKDIIPISAQYVMMAALPLVPEHYIL